MKKSFIKLAGLVLTAILAIGLTGCAQPEVKHVHTEDSGTVTAAATCVTKGEKTYKCTVCNGILRKEDIPATGNHTEDSGTVTTAPTFAEKGLRTFKCSYCTQLIRTEEIAALGWCESPIDAETFKPAESTTKYVYFGVFPKTVLPLTSTVTVDESKKVVMGANTYYLGSDGNYYAKCKENAFNTGDEYKYTDKTQVGQGETSTRYFKVEPIKWRILTDNYSGKKLLLAENILTSNVPYYEDWKNNRTIGGKLVYPNNYKESQIRAYLNGLSYYYYNTETSNTEIKSDYDGKGFLQTAFTSSAQSLIAVTQVDNSLASTGDSTNSYVCDPTEDKIFLLSYKEAYKDGYFAEKANRIRKPTDYAKANYLWQSSDASSGGSWWLRSPYYSGCSGACGVNYDGFGSANDVRHAGGGVVPALLISF